MASTPSNRPTDVFLDASVLFAAAYSQRGSARDLLVAGLQDELTTWVSDLVLEETSRNLAAKAPAALPAFNLLRSALAANVSHPSRSLVLRVARTVELKDAPIVAAAIAARARYLATYDRRHLLNHAQAIEATFGTAVATPDDILTALGLNQHR